MPTPTITQSCESTIQARFSFNGREYSKGFAIKRYGGRAQAIAAAKAWGEPLMKLLPVTKVFKKANSNTGRVGVNRIVQLDKRRGVRYLSYQVSYRDLRSGKAKCKKFHVGRADQYDALRDAQVRRKAFTFRRRYERAVTEATERKLKQAIYGAQFLAPL